LKEKQNKNPSAVGKQFYSITSQSIVIFFPTNLLNEKPIKKFWRKFSTSNQLDSVTETQAEAKSRLKEQKQTGTNKK